MAVPQPRIQPRTFLLWGNSETISLTLLAQVKLCCTDLLSHYQFHCPMPEMDLLQSRPRIDNRENKGGADFLIKTSSQLESESSIPEKLSDGAFKFMDQVKELCDVIEYNAYNINKCFANTMSWREVWDILALSSYIFSLTICIVILCLIHTLFCY